MLTLEEALKNWEQAGHHGTREQRIARGKKWLPYYAYLAQRQKDAPFSLPEKPNVFVAALLEEGAVQPGDTVLDIGAGLGSYALEFARVGCRVTALDASQECLDVLKIRAVQCGFEIETVQSTWEEFAPKQTYDVAFSSMCPAICNMEELERMESITNKTCCLITTARGSRDKHRKAMMAALDIHPQGGMTTEALHYRNALSLSGRPFRMKSMSTHSTHRISTDTALEQYPIYFHIFGVPEEKSIPFLKTYLEENAKDGFLEEESQMNLAMLFWNVNKGIK